MSAVSQAFDALAAHRDSLGSSTLRALFAADSQRFERLSLCDDDLLIDLSKNRLTVETVALLVGLARAAAVEGHRDAMLRGARINVTENRAVLHTALRAAPDADIRVDGETVVPLVRAELARCFAFADA
eukprot:gene10426-13968_t